MSPVNDFDLILPPIPSEAQWVAIINELHGCQKDAAILRAKGYNLLKEFEEPKATFERLGWLTLWSKTITALESAISAFQFGSDWILQTISRSTFEWVLHSLVILEPSADLISFEESSNFKVSVSKERQDDSNRETVNRLRAYAAWCLWADRDYYDECIHPKTLADGWSGNPAKDILADKESLQQYVNLFGTQVFEAETSEAKLLQGKRNMEKFYADKKERVARLLKDPQLKVWTDRLQDLQRRNKGSVSFFNLFDSEASVPKTLKKHGLRFAYMNYLKSSMALHGSTMEQFILFGDSSVSPRLEAIKQSDETLFKSIVADCNQIFVLLGAIDHF